MHKIIQEYFWKLIFYLKSLGNSFYRGADCCILVFDLSIHKTFDHLENWKNEFLVQANITDQYNYPFVVIGNKCDLPNRDVSIIFLYTSFRIEIYLFTLSHYFRFLKRKQKNGADLNLHLKKFLILKLLQKILFK